MKSQKRRASIVFRALNEETWFEQAIGACKEQVVSGDLDVEIILVDSGSTDGTLDIAKRHGLKLVHIKKSEFTFGRSLNMGCDAATGDFLVFISAHCIPAHDRWLANLLDPLMEQTVDYSYGRQIGHEVSRYSEKRLFAKYFPDFDRMPQEGFFCNNANAAIRTDTWAKYRFDEECTGLEDMVLAKQIVDDGGRVGYVASAPVIHIHEETFAQTRVRYYREALTLREIMPEVHVGRFDAGRYFIAGVFYDLVAAAEEGVFRDKAGEIIRFRYNQFKGSYQGHNEHRKLSREQKEAYFYPKPARSSSDRRGEPAKSRRSETSKKAA